MEQRVEEIAQMYIHACFQYDRYQYWDYNGNDIRPVLLLGKRLTAGPSICTRVVAYSRCYII